MKKTFALLVLTFLALSSIAQSWELLTPIKTDNVVRNCSFLDEQNGYCVLLADGTVLKTTDGGNSWSRPWTPGISTNLYDVEMVSMDTVFTAGISGEIFRSTDEGESFQEMTTPTSEYLYGLEFINSQIGFAVGFNGVILKTTDGGTTWEIKTSGTSSRLFDIEFVNETTGFACGWNGTVLKTTDAGETWVGLSTGYSGALFNCTFPSENVGYACGWSQTIIKTSDGGETWETQNDGSVNTLNYIEFKDEMNGWAGGDFGALFTTSNGGQSWSSSAPFGGSAIWSGQYVNENAAFLMGTGLMIKSTTGGTNWTLLKNGVSNSTFHGLYFFSDDVGYAAGSVGAFAEGTDRSGIVYTEDGGQTWDLQAFGFTGGWQDIHFADENNGTVIGGGNFGKTTNGGNTWVFSSIPFNLTGRCSWFFNASEGVIGGQGVFSSVCKTVNGGSNYTCQDNTLAADFYFTDNLNGWAVAEGSSENVLHTIDGGDSWLYVPTGNFQLKYSVFFLDENHGWIGAANGSVLRTTDGGESWETSDIGADVVGIHFYSELIGFFADNQGYVYISEDGGASWEMFLSGDDPTMQPIEEAYFTENNVYISGWGGDIYKATLGCSEIAEAQIYADDEWCVGEQNTIGFSSTTPVVDFDWQFPDGWTAEENFNSVDLTAGENSGEIQLTTFNACGLSATTQITVQVLPDVEEITSLQYPPVLCSNDTFEIAVANLQEGVEYLWTFPADWEVAEMNGSAVVNSTSGDGLVAVTAQNQCGASAEFLEEITVNPAPEISFLVPESICNNQNLTLEATPTGGEFSGEGVSGDQFDPSQITNDSAVLTYTVTSEEGCEATQSQTITLNPSEITGGNWSVFDYPTCGGDLVLELSGIENFDDWSVEYPDDWGELSDLGTEIVSVSIGDVFSDGTIYITATNDCGAEMVYSNTVEILGLPIAPVVESFDEHWCAGDSGQGTFELMLPDSLLIIETSLIYTLLQEEEQATLIMTGDPGTHFISIATENECGVSTDTSLTVVISELPEIEFSLPADTLCTENEYPFFMNPEGGEIEGIGQSDGVFQTYFLNPFQDYDFSYTYIDSLGCSATDSLTVYLEICQSIAENGDNVFRIYPNPVTQYLILETTAQPSGDYRIFDMSGREVATGSFVKGVQRINVAHLSSGSYVLSIQEVSLPFLVR